MNSKLIDKIWTAILYFISALVVLLLIILLGYILIKGVSTLNLEFLFSDPKIGEAGGGGIGPQLFNSIYMLFVSLIITVPIGIGAGIYLSEYAKEGFFLNLVRVSIETMASLPSIVVGLFGFLVFVKITNWGFYSFVRSISYINIKFAIFNESKRKCYKRSF